jgi:fatty acid desaturase
MDPSDPSDNEPDPTAPERARRTLRWAWIWVVLVPIGFATAMLLGEWAISLVGYPSGGDKVAPLWVAALVALPATLIGVFPGVAATVLGMRARRAGLRRGIVPAVIGALVVLYWAFVTIAGLAGLS